MPGAVDVRYLDPGGRDMVALLEAEAEENGGAMGLMPLRNDGVRTVLTREVVMLIVADAPLMDDVEHGARLVRMVDQDGQVLGEYVPPGHKGRVLARDPRASFISDDFCFHPDVEPVGDPLMALGELDFPLLDDIDGVINVIAGSMSPLTDFEIRRSLGYADSRTFTHLVGFDLM